MEQKLYIDIMTRKDKFIYLFLLTFWVISVIIFFSWWIKPSHIVSYIGMIINTILIAWSILLPVYYFAFLWRMRRANPAIIVPPNLHVAMIVTKVPSESFEMITDTLSHMLNQSYPHDTWLADEDPSAEIINWCLNNNVLISCRKDVSEYHRETWPRKKKQKKVIWLTFTICLAMIGTIL